MSDPSLPLQAALIARLLADTAVKALVSKRIYDEVPDDKKRIADTGKAFPYVSLGDMQVLPDKADCIDGTEVFVQIDAWSRAQGYPEVKHIGAAIVAALDDQPLTVTGYTAVVFEIQNIQYLRDPDGLTRHAALSFRALIDKA